MIVPVPLSGVSACSTMPFVSARGERAAGRELAGCGRRRPLAHRDRLVVDRRFGRDRWRQRERVPGERVDEEATRIRDCTALRRACSHEVTRVRRDPELQVWPGHDVRQWQRHGARAEPEVHLHRDGLEDVARWRRHLEGRRGRRRDQRHRDDRRDDDAVTHVNVDLALGDRGGWPRGSDVLDGVQRDRAVEVSERGVERARCVRVTGTMVRASSPLTKYTVALPARAGGLVIGSTRALKPFTGASTANDGSKPRGTRSWNT